VIKILLGAACAKSLTKLDLSDNQFNDTKEVLSAMKFCMVKNKTLTRYDFKHNNITDDGVDALIEILDSAQHVFELAISEWINEETMGKLE
jgi:Leucine-rich repeat (LRR) protein